MERQSHVEHCATFKKIWVDLQGWSWPDPRQQSRLQNRTWRTSVYVSRSDEICVFLTWSDSICYKGERITLFVWKWKETTTERLHRDWPASVDQIDPSLPRGPCLAWPPYWARAHRGGRGGPLESGLDLPLKCVVFITPKQQKREF